MPNEFDLIAQYFSRPAPKGYLGVGDDCALFSVRPGYQLATSTDLLLEGRHFFGDVSPRRLGHKALAVNLSDLSAIGAMPKGCLLGIALPSADHEWLRLFSEGFLELADYYECPLIGGDTTRSVQGISISVTVMGEVPAGRGLLRSRAQVGDDIWLSGQMGAPDLALRYLTQELPLDADRLALSINDLELPQPPVRLGADLVGVANAAVDVSDGLAQDLGHILRASRCGADIHYPLVPVHPALKDLPISIQEQAVLSGGDVFQLCFTASAAQRQLITEIAQQHQTQVTKIGQITKERGLRVFNAHDELIQLTRQGFDHFD
ncbi:thiamine-phosphate kinase [Paenalcaligenes niemegkensis]|uniref:thiamine-phosphate kinase n=1 Tax=Paenalcaligenes niemegkensis TaxID=2895469 RepID=UPI001EE939C3|nr:thiamine-phosphate kinase [Paenalcaligenes niemegkensis]MCQ9615339.1 thiamine-phosphate kinase [Paenalcaligenes niemegkensis]